MCNWSDCNGCKYYDSSVDACNCDDKCYIDGAKDFAEWLQRNDAFIADAEFDSYKPKLFFGSVESALAEWQNSKIDKNN